MEIGGTSDLPGIEAVTVEQLPVVGDVFVGMEHQTPELGILVFLELRPAGPRMPAHGPGGTKKVGPAHPPAPTRTDVAVRAADGCSPSSALARSGVASRRPKLSARRAIRSTRPLLVANS